MDKGYLLDRSVFYDVGKIGHSHTKNQTKYHSENLTQNSIELNAKFSVQLVEENNIVKKPNGYSVCQ